MPETNQTVAPPRVRLVGEFDHPDFADTLALLRAGAQIVTSPGEPPELIVVAQSRPDALSNQSIQSLRREAPLAGIIALLGTWCEGETRTGRPWPAIERTYWYEFPAWWRRQFAPPGREASRVVPNPGQRCANGLIIVHTPVRETAAALADVLHHSGYATLWTPPARPMPLVRGMVAAIWDGGQLYQREQQYLATFCRQLARDAAPVIALLDFPRRDRLQRARELGAAAVLSKPWLDVDLVAMLEIVMSNRTQSSDGMTFRAA